MLLVERCDLINNLVEFYCICYFNVTVYGGVSCAHFFMGIISIEVLHKNILISGVP